jgi:hypothetical protein
MYFIIAIKFYNSSKESDSLSLISFNLSNSYQFVWFYIFYNFLLLIVDNNFCLAYILIFSALLIGKLSLIFHLFDLYFVILLSSIWWNRRLVLQIFLALIKTLPLTRNINLISLPICNSQCCKISQLLMLTCLHFCYFNEFIMG